jgi:hypothetical protein
MYLGFTIWHSLFTGTFCSLEFGHSEVSLSFIDQLDPKSKEIDSLLRAEGKAYFVSLLPLPCVCLPSCQLDFSSEMLVKDTY